MTRWAMVADLRRCVGCQTCTASCKHTNATSPAVQWRRVLDIESGEFPNVKRTFVPVGCMHCEDPPCMHVCPSTATGQRDDGIVTIDYDICIGCSYCAVACPYQARYKVDKPIFSYGASGQMKNELAREDPARLGVAQKCTFCSDRVDYGLENGLTPGIDEDATPACVNSCIAGALHFGDLENAKSNVSTLLDENLTFRMHEEVGTNAGFHYIWADKDQDIEEPQTYAKEACGTNEVGGAEPWLQQHWDWRAAGNFIGGGTGSGLLIVAAVASLFTTPVTPSVLPGLGFVGLGLFLVWLETGRPLRAPLNVLRNLRTSWMTRESVVAMALFPLGLLAYLSESITLLLATGCAALGFLYCQARILMAARGIPAWRIKEIVPLILSTGIVEGIGLFSILLVFLAPQHLAENPVLWGSAVVIVTLMRAWAWSQYRHTINQSAPIAAREALKRISKSLAYIGHGVPVVFGTAIIFNPAGINWIALLAGLLMVGSGWLIKSVIILRAAYNQGFAIERTPMRGDGGAGPGARPGY
jgi:Fe-S-cluster-containing dehydrogenase component